MCQEHADYHAVGSQQIATFESIQCQKCCGQQHQKQDWKLTDQFFHGDTKIFKGCIKVDKSSNDHGNKIKQDCIIIIIQIDEFNISENDQHIQHAGHTQGAFFLFFDNTKRNKKVIHDADQDNADNNKRQQDKITVILPESPGSCRGTEVIKVNQEEDPGEEQGRAGGKHQFIITFSITVKQVSHGKDTVGLTIVHRFVFGCDQQYNVNQNHNSQRHQ